MKIFKRTKTIETDLGNLTMKEIMKFPEKKNAGLQEFYINRVFNTNHIQIKALEKQFDLCGIHDFEYDQNTKKIKIFSRIQSLAFRIYLFPLSFFIIAVLEKEINMLLIGLSIVVFIITSLMLLLGINSESKEIEREMVLRINFIRRNKR